MTENIKTQKEKKPNLLLATFTKGIFKENNVLITMLGLCPALAITTTFEAGLGMGIIVTIVLAFTNMTISLLRKVIPNEVRIPCYIVIIATEVTIVHMLTKAFMPDLAANLGVFIPLITVNCIIFGRAEAFASKNKVGLSALDGLGAGLGCLVAFVIAGLVREIIGTGEFSFFKLIPGPSFTLSMFPNYAIDMFVKAPGAFIIIAIMLAVTKMIITSKEEKR